MRALAALVAIGLTLVLAGPAVAARLYIRGAGDGHGVGMSQYGAYGYALHGKDYRFILEHYYEGTQVGSTDPDRIVRVLLASRPAAAFSGATGAGNKRLNPAMTYTVRALRSGSLSLVSGSGKHVATFPAPLTVSGSGPLNVAGLGRYRGSLEFRPNGSGGVYTVNAVGLDDYVRGVLAAEMPASWSAAALEAQAVAARTYAITSDVSGSFFNLYPDTRSQVYRGVGAETPATNAAVQATSGQIVTYDGSPAITYFFASSGGYTEDVQNVWPGAAPEPWLRGVPDPYDGAGGDPYHRWSLQLSIAAATRRLGSLVKGRLLGIKVTVHGVSPRIMLAQVLGTRGRTTVTGAALEQAFGLMSTYARFTTISTAAKTSVPRSIDALRTESGDTGAALAFGKQLHGLMSTVAPAIEGTVFPAARGTNVTIEARGPRRWRTVARARLGRGGAFQTTLSEPGTYRIAYQGLTGPPVLVP